MSRSSRLSGTLFEDYGAQPVPMRGQLIWE